MGSYKQTIDLKKLFSQVYDALKNEKTDFSQIRYLIVANYNSPGLISKGNAIIIQGDDFLNNLNDFKNLQSSAIFLNNTYDYETILCLIIYHIIVQICHTTYILHNNGSSDYLH